MLIPFHSILLGFIALVVGLSLIILISCISIFIITHAQCAVIVVVENQERLWRQIR
ncbi:uncharacterized protein BT62DRAFT_925663 [Guyanagaster necrorhizus]|uniref:Uncharacterized protein n=1 Tax=Guyanagaster necrorhizus TaxID=856835 RepID=A0A9P7W708_9AGAR|nr:uncharacterized protein BT62DRAFT_925663 [Guyanagaster necrorhizus MCA 3950]KAG7453120.1 hypothetical protein BT62DRAFT_925663 [Guyanagaster necrorhizus MCA 3950]